jgi:hypothetical protein
VASWLTFRGLLRTRWAVWLGLAVLVGAIAGVVIAASAGVRRTASAYDRFLDHQNAYDAMIELDCSSQSEPADHCCQDCVDDISEMPSVADVTIVEEFGALVATDRGQSLQPDLSDECFSGPGQVRVLSDPSGRFGHELNRSGSLPVAAPIRTRPTRWCCRGRPPSVSTWGRAAHCTCRCSPRGLSGQPATAGDRPGGGDRSRARGGPPAFG